MLAGCLLCCCRPEGFVTLEREDGSWREGFCLNGRWDGLVRDFDEDRTIKVEQAKQHDYSAAND